jgi:hypothetical protein
MNDDLVISSEQVAELRDYCQAMMGISISDCIGEAIADWLLNVAPARLEGISHVEKPDNVIPFRKAG